MNPPAFTPEQAFWLELAKIASPVLIGLITSFGAHFLLRAHERNKEHARRRYDSFEKVTTGFDLCCAELRDALSAMQAARPARESMPSPDTQEELQNLSRQAKRAHVALDTLQGRLLALGETDAAIALYEFGFHCDSMRSGLMKHSLHLEKWGKFDELRGHVIGLLVGAVRRELGFRKPLEKNFDSPAFHRPFAKIWTSREGDQKP
jgi:hypothetical protein